MKGLQSYGEGTLGRNDREACFAPARPGVPCLRAPLRRAATIPLSSRVSWPRRRLSWGVRATPRRAIAAGVIAPRWWRAWPRAAWTAARALSGGVDARRRRRLRDGELLDGEVELLRQAGATGLGEVDARRLEAPLERAVRSAQVHARRDLPE